MGLFGVINSHVSLLLSFKAKKVKKAALVAKNTKLQTRKLLSSKILSYHLVMCTFCPNFNPTFQIGGFKGQNVPQRPQNWWISNFIIKWKSNIWKKVPTMSYQIFLYALILRPLGSFLAFKIPLFQCEVILDERYLKKSH